MTLQKPLSPSSPNGLPVYPVSEQADLSAPRHAHAIDLAVLLRILRVRRQVILGTAAAVVALAIVILFQLTPYYAASSVVMLDQRKNSIEDVSSVLSGLPTDPTGVQNQVQILTSRDIAGRVIDKLNLKDNAYFRDTKGWTQYLAFLNPASWFPSRDKMHNDALGLNSERNRLIDEFEKHLTVTPLGLSTAIRVTYESPDRYDAATIDNAIADAYVEDQLNAKFEATQKATKWLADRIQDLSKQSQAAEEAVQQYRAANGLSETQNGGSVVDQQMSAISAQLVAAKSDLAEKEATYSHISALARAGHAADISEAVSSPLIAQLRSQEADLMRQEADLSSKYGPRNPKMLDLESQKTNLESKINEEVERVVRSVANNVAIAQAQVGSLESSLKQIESQSGDQNKLKVKLAALQSNAASAKSMYEAFLSKLNQTQDQQGIETPDARIISRGEVPIKPSYPNKLLVLGVAIPVGFLLGLMFAAILERLDSGFRTTYQVETVLGFPVLATIPEVPPVSRGEPVNAADRIVDKPMSSFSEAIRGLHLALSLSNVDKQPKVIVVTSSVPGEGKTTLAVSLARLGARSGLKTIIVDGDLRRPTVASALGLRDPRYGVVEAVTGTQSLENCFAKDPRSDALALPCVTKPASPSDLLASQAMRHLIQNLAKAFDLVIIDSAPVLPVNDTKILSQLVDTVLFVTRWEKTPRDGVSNALRSLMDAHAPIAGIALARADMSRFQYYSYGYQDYHYYNKYYTD
ncbi:MAG TPA: polysaccharide biosynthesis tyrosine autokinase [Rhizomicrobium sp.]|nr:polysaccharide biosynthesis tyrosine autokinase [Rhizomicrobium sp.]